MPTPPTGYAISSVPSGFADTPHTNTIIHARIVSAHLCPRSPARGALHVPVAVALEVHILLPADLTVGEDVLAVPVEQAPLHGDLNRSGQPLPDRVPMFVLFSAGYGWGVPRPRP